MGINPVPALSFALVWTLYVAVVSAGVYATQEIPECTGFLDFTTGCDNLFSVLLSTIVIGTVPTAPPLMNLFFAIIGILARTTVLWAIIQWARGV